MKTLTLLRHAKSAWEDGIVRDFDRPLNAKGARAARTIGRWLRDQGTQFDHVVASPAARVRETLTGMWAGYGSEPPVTFDERLYLASVDMMLDLIRAAPEEAERMLLVGHNPGLEELVLALVPEGSGDVLRDDVEEKFPTASVAVILLSAERWDAVDRGSGRLDRFTRPRDLDAALGPDRE